MKAKDLEPVIYADIVYSEEKINKAVNAFRAAVWDDPRKLLDEVPALYAELCKAIMFYDSSLAQKDVIDSIDE